MHKLLIHLSLCMLVTACRAQVVTTTVPALLTNPGAAMLQQIEQTVSAAMGGNKVTLAADAFTHSSVLVIERGLQRGITRNPELGRDLGRPFRFQLFVEGSNCVVLDQQTGMYWPLTDAVCISE